MSSLSLSCAWGIATARGVYREIGREVVRGGAEAVSNRVFTSRTQKAGLAIAALGPALTSRLPLRPRPRSDLWSAI